MPLSEPHLARGATKSVWQHETWRSRATVQVVFGARGSVRGAIDHQRDPDEAGACSRMLALDLERGTSLFQAA